MAKSKLDPTMTRYEIVTTMAAGCSDLAPFFYLYYAARMVTWIFYY